MIDAHIVRMAEIEDTYLAHAVIQYLWDHRDVRLIDIFKVYPREYRHDDWETTGTGLHYKPKWTLHHRTRADYLNASMASASL